MGWFLVAILGTGAASSFYLFVTEYQNVLLILSSLLLVVTLYFTTERLKNKCMLSNNSGSI